MNELYEEKVKTRSYQIKEDHSRSKNNWVWGLEREKSVWGCEELDSIERERNKRNSH